MRSNLQRNICQLFISKKNVPAFTSIIKHWNHGKLCMSSHFLIDALMSPRTDSHGTGIPENSPCSISSWIRIKSACSTFSNWEDFWYTLLLNSDVFAGFNWTIPSDTASTVLQATAINWNWKERQLIEHLTRRFFKINGKNTHTGKNAKTCIKAFEANDFKQTQKKQKPLPKQHPYWSRSAFSWGQQTKMSATSVATLQVKIARYLYTCFAPSWWFLMVPYMSQSRLCPGWVVRGAAECPESRMLVRKGH